MRKIKIIYIYCNVKNNTMIRNYQLLTKGYYSLAKYEQTVFGLESIQKEVQEKRFFLEERGVNLKMIDVIFSQLSNWVSEGKIYRNIEAIIYMKALRFELKDIL